MTQEYSIALSHAAAECAAHVKAIAAPLSATFGLPPSAVDSELANAVADMLRDTGYSHGNGTMWRCRALIYDDRDLGNPEADSDPGLPPEAPGDEVLKGLPAVAAWGCTLARMHHHTPCMGLGKNQTRAIQTVRNMLYRRGDGTGVMTIPYTTTRMVLGSQAPQPLHMTMKIHLVKVGSDADVARVTPRRLPGLVAK